MWFLATRCNRPGAFATRYFPALKSDVLSSRNGHELLQATRECPRDRHTNKRVFLLAKNNFSGRTTSVIKSPYVPENLWMLPETQKRLQTLRNASKLTRRFQALPDASQKAGQLDSWPRKPDSWIGGYIYVIVYIYTCVRKSRKRRRNRPRIDQKRS